MLVIEFVIEANTIFSNGFEREFTLK